MQQHPPMHSTMHTNPHPHAFPNLSSMSDSQDMTNYHNLNASNPMPDNNVAIHTSNTNNIRPNIHDPNMLSNNHETHDQELVELINPIRPSLDQYRTEIAFRIERERNRMETEISHEKSRSERAKFLDALQVQKDQILLQFIQEHLEARAVLLRNAQFIASKISDIL